MRSTAIAGPNFSGKTDYLKRLSTPRSSFGNLGVRSLYIGPEVYNSISGVSRTVAEEFELLSPRGAASQFLTEAIESLNLGLIQHLSPFQLSGGLQSLVVLLAAAANNPRVLAVDCALEQVGPELKRRALTHCERSLGGIDFYLADNRLAELDFRLNHYSAAPSQFKLDLPKSYIDGSSAPFDIVSSAPTLTVEAVTFSYDKRNEVLRGFTVELAPGKVYTLSGDNGAGKSTLAKILAGVLKPCDGHLYSDGARVRPWRAPGRLVAYHFQNPDLQLFCDTVEEEVGSGPRALNFRSPEVSEALETTLRSFGLGGFRAAHPLDLPFVLRKRVALAATLAMRRPWLILDEPTLGQDDSNSDQLAILLKRLASTGHGVIAISHSRDFRESLGGEDLLLYDGRLA